MNECGRRREELTLQANLTSRKGKIMISFFVSKVNARRGESRFPSQLFCRSFDLP
jgi:hypothetical protein